MTESLESLLARREIVAAYVAVSARLDELIRICATTPGGRDEVRAAVQRVFGLGVMPADAVLAMQVLRFSPLEQRRAADELADLDARIKCTDV
ncbi:hypothetical protein [Microbacterium arborescens]